MKAGIQMAAIVTVSFAAGFITFMIIASGPEPILVQPLDFPSPTEKCKADPRCIPTPSGPPPPNELTFMGWYKVSKILEIVNDPIIQDALKKSNEEWSAMPASIREQILEQREKEWTTAKHSTPFMLSIINNDIADFLSKKTRISSEEFGEVVFGEHILTNIYGPNVAVTIRTDNYDQSNDDWWKLANDVELLVRQCDWDASAEMNSEDIVIRIVDENNALTGIMNSATPCNVLKEGITEFPSPVN